MLTMLSPEVLQAFRRRDAMAVKSLLAAQPALREMIDKPLFPFDSPAIVAFANDPAMVHVLLEFGADPNRRSTWWAGGFHALHSATGAAAELLLAAGAEPDACAAAHLDRTDLLADILGSNPSRVHERGGDGQTPLHFARSRDIADMLLDAGADIDARDVDHRSSPAEWMLAGRRGAGRYDLSHYLVQRGATADIILACALGLTGRVTALARETPALLEERTGRGSYGEQPPSSYHIYMWTIGDARPPLDVAAQFEQKETFDALLDLATPMQRFVAWCRRADGDNARALLRAHPTLREQMTADHHRPITDAAWDSDADAVALMLDLGFDPRTPGHDSGTALHCAAWQGSTACTSTLLQHPEAHSLLHLRDAHYNATPLGWCCHGSMHGDTTRDHALVARLLLEAGATPETRDASAAVRDVIDAFA